MLDYAVPFALGARATIAVPAENRAWGYKPASNGTEIEVVGYGEIVRGRTNNFGYEPGVYHRPDTLLAKTGSGLTFLIDARFLEGEMSELKVPGNSLRKADLPETAFWEDDIVTLASRTEEGILVILGINWETMGDLRKDGRPMPLYRVGPPSGGSHVSADATDVTLVERGNIWRLAHGEATAFKDLEEEASLAYRTGRYTGMRNKATGDFSWTKDQVLDAIEAGYADAAAGDGDVMPWGTSVYAIEFNDRDLGARVASETLARTYRAISPRC